MGSIPGYRPGPILSGGKKAFLASLVVIPAGTYLYLTNKRANDVRNQRLLEEEGRENWDVERAKTSESNYEVRVNRSGGGV